MTQTVFLRLDALLARASKTGTVLPSIVLTLCSTARLEFAFVDAEDAVGPLTGTVISVQCGVKIAPDSDDVLLLTDCATTGEGAASRRIAEWSATSLDNDELRDFLGGELSKTGTTEHGPWMEIVVDRDGVVDRFSFPITLKNAFIRPEDAAPNPRDDASWTWLKSRIAVSGALISKAIDDTLKKIILSVAVTWSDITGKPSTFTPGAHSHSITDVTDLEGALGAKMDSSQRGANNGVAPLDSGGKVPAANLPSYVDDVIEAANLAALPGTGETGKIYVTLDTGKTYRWSGSTYVVLNELPAFASQAEAEAGTNNSTLMTPLRTAQAIAALGGGGGGGSDLYLTAWVDVEHGNDDTGELGNIAKPFAQIQAAYTAGARIFMLGAGNVGVLYVAGGDLISLVGCGRGRSTVAAIYCFTFSSSNITILGNGAHNVTVDVITITPAASAIASTGGSTMGTISINGLHCTGNVSIAGQPGAPGDAGDDAYEPSSPGGGNRGGDGGPGPTVEIADCIIVGTVLASGGGGGAGGSGGSSRDSYTDGAAGGDGGNGGAGGFLNLMRSTVGGAVGAPPGGFGPHGAGGNGASNGADGSDGIDGSAGTIVARWCDIEYAPANGESTTYSFCGVAGSWV